MTEARDITAYIHPSNLPLTCIACGTRLLEDERAIIQPRKFDVTGPIYAIVIHERCERWPDAAGRATVTPRRET